MLSVSDDASFHVCIHERTSNSTVTEEGRERDEKGEEGEGRRGGQLNCADDSTFYFPKHVLKGGQTVCFATNLS